MALSRSVHTHSTFFQQHLKKLSSKLEALENLLRHPPEATVIMKSDTEQPPAAATLIEDSESSSNVLLSAAGSKDVIEHDPVILITAPSVESSSEDSTNNRGKGGKDGDEPSGDVEEEEKKKNYKTFPGSGGKIIMPGAATLPSPLERMSMSFEEHASLSAKSSTGTVKEMPLHQRQTQVQVHPDPAGGVESFASPAATAADLIRSHQVFSEDLPADASLSRHAVTPTTVFPWPPDKVQVQVCLTSVVTLAGAKDDSSGALPLLQLDPTPPSRRSSSGSCHETPAAAATTRPPPDQLLSSSDQSGLRKMQEFEEDLNMIDDDDDDDDDEKDKMSVSSVSIDEVSSSSSSEDDDDDEDVGGRLHGLASAATTRPSSLLSPHDATAVSVASSVSPTTAPKSRKSSRNSSRKGSTSHQEPEPQSDLLAMISPLPSPGGSRHGSIFVAAADLTAPPEFSDPNAVMGATAGSARAADEDANVAAAAAAAMQEMQIRVGQAAGQMVDEAEEVSTH